MTEYQDAVVDEKYLGVPVALFPMWLQKKRENCAFFSDCPVPVMTRSCGVFLTGEITLAWGYEQRGL